MLLTTLLFALAAHAEWVTPDFFVTRAPIGALVRAAADCRANIARALCLVDPAPEGGDLAQDRPCLPGGEAYAPYFESLHDAFPAHLQKMFCHLHRIYIEKEFIGSAYGGLFKDPQHPERTVGGVLGVRRSLLDPAISLSRWAGWKEQLHFGTDASEVKVEPGLPHVSTSLGDGVTSMLYFLVAHEFGHIFDFENGLNDGGSWQALSWRSFDVPLPENEFPLRKDLCFYFCKGSFIAAERQDELYRDLAKTNFISAYATRYAAEDFADTLAYYTLLTEKAPLYRVITASGRVYAPVERLRADPRLESKRRYLERFLASPYRYPGDNPR